MSSNLKMKPKIIRVDLRIGPYPTRWRDSKIRKQYFAYNFFENYIHWSIHGINSIHPQFRCICLMALWSKPKFMAFFQWKGLHVTIHYHCLDMGSWGPVCSLAHNHAFMLFCKKHGNNNPQCTHKITINFACMIMAHPGCHWPCLKWLCSVY